MAASTSFSPAAAALCTSKSSSRKCANYALVGAHSSPSLPSPSRAAAGDSKWLQQPKCNKRLVMVQHQSQKRSPSSRPSSSGRPLLLPRCYSESNETDSAASSSSTSPPQSPTPLESSSSGGVESSSSSGEFPSLGQQRRRPQGARREADSTDWISSSLTRRFGLAGGLAWVGFLAFGVISEQIKTRTEVFLESQGTQNVEGTAKEVVLDNNVKYVDLRTGGGSSPLKGDLVLLDLTGKVASTGEVFVDTTSAKRPLAFVYGIKPYAKGVCYGLEYALQSMKAGGKRRVKVPADQCFGDAGEDLGNGVIVPGGAEVEYEVQLQRVSIAPS
ncbi:unnamed protein product [Calypogeia fissa]